MKHAMGTKRWAVGLVMTGLVAGSLGGLIPTAVAAPAGTSGDDWSVEQVPGGYEVTVELDEPLEMRDDAPSIEADGKSLGIATESADGNSISLVTSDPAVLKADDFEAGWSSAPAGATTAKSAAVTDVPETSAPAIDADPTSIGSYDWTEATYNFGAQSIPMAGIGGIRGDLQGKIYLPDTGGARPTVILLHGRHTSCSQGTPNPNRWPCGANQINVPSYKGYDGTGRALASHGYAVVSISANAINSNDAQLTLDNGALARGQLILDSIAMLDKATKGQNPTYHDAQFDIDVPIAQALGSAKDPNDPADANTPDETLTPAQLVGRFDLSNIGIMGHSRGGEGATAAVTLNQALPTPWAIKSVLPLAPVDFGRMTVADIPMQVILPYCDGDVSNQQGQHMIDDSRYAFGDNVLRSAVWVMGANHNFFNTRWTPSKYPFSSSDDWSNSTARRNDSICGTDPSVAATSIRLSDDAQYNVGTAWMAGWFRMTMGGENQFLPLFDGSGATPAVLNGPDVRSFSTAPATKRNTLATFEESNSLIRSYGTATATPCASLTGRTVPVSTAYCAITTPSSAAPHWTPASFGGNVPATPMTRMLWTTDTGEVRVTVPVGKRDQSAYERLSVKIAADETVVTGTDLTLTVKDGSGHTFSSLVSALNPFAVNRFPTSLNSTTLKKVVLSQVNVPVATLAAAGIVLSDVREVSFKAGVGADATPAGGVYLSDLAFESSSVGTAVVKKEATLNVAPTTVDEGNGPGTADVAVYREGSTAGTAVGWVSILGSATGRGGIALEKVTFAPGEVCKVVTGSLLGDTATSTANATLVKTTVINTAGAVMGDDAFTNLTVREDDGVTGSATALPPAGIPGNPCVERTAIGGPITASDSTPAPGQSITLSGGGYRAGEGVTFSVDGVALPVVVADGSGVASSPYTVAGDAPYGTTAFTSVAAGSGIKGSGSATVLASTATSLEVAPVAPKVKQAVTLTATVTGAQTAGTVEFRDGATVLGSASTSGGVATLPVPGGFLSGQHSLTATFAQTATAQGSASTPVVLTLLKGASTIALALSHTSSTYGTKVTANFAVSGVQTGVVKLTYGDVVASVPITGGAGTFSLPATLAPGTYPVTVKFEGDEEYDPSPTASASLTVGKRATSSKLVAPTTVKVGKSFVVTAAVAGSVAGTYPTGNVEFWVKVGVGAYKKLSTKALTAASKGLVSYTVAAKGAPIVVRIKAVYLGSTNYAGSTSPIKVVTVKK